MIWALKLPEAFAGMDEVRVLKWHQAPGARFEVDALLMEFETDKTVVEVRAERRAFCDGRYAREDDFVKLGHRRRAGKRIGGGAVARIEHEPGPRPAR